MIFPPNRWNKITSFHRPSRKAQRFLQVRSSSHGRVAFGVPALLTYFLVRTSHFISIVPTSDLNI